MQRCNNAGMLSDEVALAIAQFFAEGHGPSHDELDRLIARAHLAHVDPRMTDPVAGKVKRVRAVLLYATSNDEDAGQRLVGSLIPALRASGSFRSGDDNYAGDTNIQALQDALSAVGFDLTADGVVNPKSMEGLHGTDLTNALQALVKRARSAGDDAALRIGTAKELAEATARHVLVERVGSYPPHGNFQATLYQAYTVLGVAAPDLADLGALSGDAWESVERALFILACAVNRYRNEAGTGHGRPQTSTASQSQGRLAAEASALVSELLLSQL